LRVAFGNRGFQRLGIRLTFNPEMFALLPAE
jgi:hypothetical protein